MGEIIVTGAAGFIASALASDLSREGKSLVLVDDFSIRSKQKNFQNLKEATFVQRADFFNWLSQKDASEIELIIHLGARTDTAEQSVTLFEELNISYSQRVWNYCSDYEIPLIYASSAATYGDGKLGFEDSHELISSLKPLNPYGDSKNLFDIWALEQEKTPPFWAGLKFFNVYGPNEYHKGRMASVIFHAFNQIKETGKMKLFRSHNANFEDGQQLRDFIYVKDIVHVINFLKENGKTAYSGIYNLGTGKADSFYHLVKYTFEALDLPEVIEYIDIPEDIRENYQYFTEANMKKLVNIGYKRPFTSLEEGVKDYVKQYLNKNSYF
ncbi:MAG: ADP-glyceromanno-heptose 6-epimerase [Flavobacteriales bacterium]|nr:ADP-glyceromanno-heptose 6-epimerase [Flavobacteriales bacterium]